MSQTNKLNNFMSRCVQNAEIILKAHQDAIDLRDEWTKLGLDSAAIDAVLTETPESDNQHLTGTILTAYITSIDNLTTYMNAGNGTNLYKLKR